MQKSAATDDPVHELMAERWSSRSFAEGNLAPEVLGSLFEAARWAPSCYNDQPWTFLVATRADGAGFERFAACLHEGNSWARAAPVLILTVARTSFQHDGGRNRHALHDVGLATGNLVLQAQAMGLATHQMAGFDVDRAAAAVGLPEGFEPVTMIAVGRRGTPERLPGDLREREVAPRTRRPLSEMVHGSAWGKPLTTTCAVRD